MNWFRNRRTATKLMIGFGVVVALLMVVAAVGDNGMSSMNTSFTTLYQRHALGIVHLENSVASLLRISRAVRASMQDDNPEKIRGRSADIARFREEFRSSLEEYKTRAVQRTTIEEAERVRRDFDALAPEQDKVLALSLAGNIKEAKANLDRIAGMADAIDRQMDKMEETKVERMKGSFAEAAVAFERARTILLILSVVAAIGAFIIGLTLARMIGRPLTQSVEILTAFAAGDFTRRLDISSSDEVGQMAKALNRASQDMREALLGVKSRTVEVSGAADQLAQASSSLASGAQEQASSLEETSASLEEITSTVKQNADNARHANQLAAGSRDTAEKGGQIIAATQTAMNEINASSKKIADIISTVDEIAFQTNLLALNAAVEAARAGEQGRGFAVVAGEVRNLAQRSAVAAKEIKALIQDSVRKVDSGTHLVNQSGETLTEIVTSVKRVTDIVSEIAAASSEQATGISQVAQAMAQMDKVTQGNTAQTEELSATAQNLSQQAVAMRELVGRFKLGEHSTGLSARRPSARKPDPSRFQPAPKATDTADSFSSSNSDLTALAVHTDSDGFEQY